MNTKDYTNEEIKKILEFEDKWGNESINAIKCIYDFFKENKWYISEVMVTCLNCFKITFVLKDKFINLDELNKKSIEVLNPLNDFFNKYRGMVIGVQIPLKDEEFKIKIIYDGATSRLKALQN